jgi:hypothetical protein
LSIELIRPHPGSQTCSAFGLTVGVGAGAVVEAAAVALLAVLLEAAALLVAALLVAALLAVLALAALADVAAAELDAACVLVADALALVAGAAALDALAEVAAVPVAEPPQAASSAVPARPALVPALHRKKLRRVKDRIRMATTSFAPSALPMAAPPPVGSGGQPPQRGKASARAAAPNGVRRA